MFTHWTNDSFDETKVISPIAHCYKLLSPYFSFLVSPHPYRKGSVCPFVQSALDQHAIFFVPAFDNEHWIVTEAIKFYLQWKEKHEILGSVVVFFPEDYPVSDLLTLHRSVVEECAKDGLMIGALYSTSQAESLHSKEWYPLRTPIPVLVIRDMVPNDIVFINPSPVQILAKLRFVRYFLGKVGHSNKALQLRRGYRKKLAIFVGMVVALVLVLSFVALL